MASVQNPAVDRQMPVDEITPWWDQISWWLHPSQSYVKGLIDGLRMACPDCAHLDEQVHRAAVENAIRIVETTDRRAAADAGTLTITEQAA